MSGAKGTGMKVAGILLVLAGAAFVAAGFLGDMTGSFALGAVFAGAGVIFLDRARDRSRS